MLHYFNSENTRVYNGYLSHVELEFVWSKVNSSQIRITCCKNSNTKGAATRRTGNKMARIHWKLYSVGSFHGGCGAVSIPYPIEISSSHNLKLMKLGVWEGREIKRDRAHSIGITWREFGVY